jgi:hypothetical protein
MIEASYHAGARSALKVTAILCMVTVIGLPFGIWMLLKMRRCRLTLRDDGIHIRNLVKTTDVAFAEVQRIGTLRVPVPGFGIAGKLAQRKVGGRDAIHLCFLTPSGTQSAMISMYEHHEQVVREAARIVDRPLETVGFGLKWPDQKSVKPTSKTT